MTNRTVKYVLIRGENVSLRESLNTGVTGINDVRADVHDLTDVEVVLGLEIIEGSEMNIVVAKDRHHITSIES